LNLFYSTLQAQIPSGYGPIIESIDGGTIDVPEYINYNAEADLDLEYAIALGKL
jgi:tripeptidyl-peptidase-1